MRYLIVNENGITEELSNKVLNLLELRELVGNPKEKDTYTEFVFNMFPDRSIVCIVDEEGALPHKALKPVMRILPSIHCPRPLAGYTLYGQVIICAMRQKGEDSDIGSLTPRQIEAIKRDIVLLKEVSHV